jgi:ParB family chromosome partitioning protein
MEAKKKEKPKHLGRGLQSLMSPILIAAETLKERNDPPIDSSNFPPDKELRESLRDVPIKSIVANPYQVRTVWNEEELEDLAASIKANGLIQPIIVRSSGSGYELIAGERRFRASQMAGLDNIQAMVRTATDEQMLELALVENIHRVDLNPIERAKAYKNYLDNFSLTQVEAAERLGENRSVVANYLRLLDLPDDIKQMLAKGELSMGHARAILGLPTDDMRRRLANRAMAGRLSVREVERLVRKYLAGSEQSRAVPRIKPVHVIDLESRLSTRLGTKVNIDVRRNGQRGKIIIDFYSLDEFDRIADRMGLEAVEEV